MKQVRVTIAADGPEREFHPMYDLLANASFVSNATAIQWDFTGESLGVLHYVEGEMEAFDAAVSEIAPVIDHILERDTENGFYAYVLGSTTERLRRLLDAVLVERLVVIPPVQFDERGRITLTLFGPSERIQSVLDAVRPLASVRVERVGSLTGLPSVAQHPLTERQREALEVGVELGYYEVPREASHEAVAAELDCAPSTAAEHLQKSQAKVVKSALRWR